VIAVTYQVKPGAAFDAEKVTKRLHAEAKHAMTRIVGMARENLRDNLSIATGHLLASVQGGADRVGGSILGWLGAARYWQAVEEGTPPHIAPIVTPDGGGLLRWVVAKGLVRKSGDWVEQHKRGGVSVKGGFVRNNEKRQAALTELVRHVSRYSADYPAGKRVRGNRLLTAATLTRKEAEHLASGEAFVNGKKVSKSVVGAARMRLRMESQFNPLRVERGTVRGKLGFKMSKVERAELSMAYAVQQTIADHGTKARPFVEPAVRRGFAELIMRLKRGGF
jgi:hypothetical protein